ncbi:MAG: glutathione S-transferase family protein [Parvularculaceae bacterium]
MSELTLYIGDKNLSSWSLRPWLLLTQSGIPFTEICIRLDRPTSKGDILAKSPSGLVPSLTHNGLTIWDSLAICEYLAETFPERKMWPAETAARARARSISAEMHSGFADLRKNWPMKFAIVGLRQACPPEVKKNIDRIDSIWSECRKTFGADGPFLFGKFSIADAMYAPVASRFETYGPVSLSAEGAAYQKMLIGLPAMKAWGEGASAEITEEG